MQDKTSLDFFHKSFLSDGVSDGVHFEKGERNEWTFYYLQQTVVLVGH